MYSKSNSQHHKNPLIHGNSGGINNQNDELAGKDLIVETEKVLDEMKADIDRLLLDPLTPL